uniref:Protein phosphatase, Mg2+/Mn2+ dependent 1K n=1 Tax=Molossus molossus TaxID=27622 RepID=A0A7J8JZ38_MOLMO|nr:protein phosphatase, Mg2+/Mn2+ dependent 1K [Molossus molossus]
MLFLCPPLCCRFVMFEHNSWVNFLFASVRVICGRELCLLSSSRPGARGHYMLGFSGKRDQLNFVPATVLTSGTTATVALLRDGIELVVASVGDSRAILCRKGKSIKLTTDHTPERKDEKERIKKCGGFIAWNSLGQPHVNGRLAMTRSLGDLDLKSSGVIAEPETKRIKLHHASDSFLVLTTDGINFMVNSQEICDFVNQCHDPSEAAHAVTEQAIQYGAEDNSTIIVVPFGAWGKYKNSEINFSFSRSFASSGRWA